MDFDTLRRAHREAEQACTAARAAVYSASGVLRAAQDALAATDLLELTLRAALVAQAKEEGR